MSDKTFVDSNVLVYAHDADAPAKRRIAKEILKELWSERTGVVSVQVLQEFYVNVTCKIETPLAKGAARRVISSYFAWCQDISTSEVSAAFRIQDEVRISFWDALIIAAAAKSGATRILSEDLNAGQRISGIRIVNPFL